MQRKKNVKFFVGDFETTVYDGQTSTEVWASAVVELGSNDVYVCTTIADTLKYLSDFKSHVLIYYHNLKFDGEFWISWLLKNGYTPAYTSPDRIFDGRWQNDKDMRAKSFKVVISEVGQWYQIKIKLNSKIIEIRDSLKLLPFSVEKIAKSFNTVHKKLSIKYDGEREVGAITDEELEYIKNDVLVVKEALEIMFAEGHNRLTIGSCCLADFRKGIDFQDYEIFFPDLTKIKCPIDGYSSADEYVRKSYHGGWCYLKRGSENKVYKKGVTADVNSLYPSMMHSESGNVYPVGVPTFWLGDIPTEVIKHNRYYFIRIKTKFRLKKDHLPCIQIKTNYFYDRTEWLETSDVFWEGAYHEYYKDEDGNVQDTSVILTLTCTDYQLIKEHYNLIDCEILDGCWFYTEDKIFDMYINKYREIKIKEKGAKRELAKLFLNNLYGKMASNTESNFRYVCLDGAGNVHHYIVPANDKKAGYIAIGSAITSYARNFTIRHAQKNYKHFIYADTDSIHCNCSEEELVGIKKHPTDFNAWKVESWWDEGIFVRQKTYIEHITHEDGEELERARYNIKCAGMPERCKQLFLESIGDIYLDDKTEEEIAFCDRPRALADFKVGLCIPSKLRPRRIDGGVILEKTTYEMR